MGIQRFVICNKLPIGRLPSVHNLQFIIMDTYKTIETTSEGIYKDKGSKFLSFAIPVNSVNEIKEILKTYRKQFFDARHICYAYLLGVENREFRANDDGEPSGTAGRPILGQINSNRLTNILVIVVRYFGGTLLGTSGLITAYKEATANAIENAQIVEKMVEENIVVKFEYPLMNAVMKIVKDLDASVVRQQFELDCLLEVRIRKQLYETMKEKLNDIEGIIIL